MQRFAALFFMIICIVSTINASIQSTIARLREFGTPLEVIQAYDQALSTDQKNAHLHYEFGTYLADLDRPDYYEKAWSHLDQAITLNPQQFTWLFYYGVYCCRIGKLQHALGTYQKLLQIRPNMVGILYNSAYSLKISGDLTRAIGLYKKVLSIKPEHENAHLGLAFSYLGLGNYKKGWSEHEWNLKKQRKYAQELRTLVANNAVSGKTILLLPEGGLGDTINFVRYAQRLKAMGAKVIVAVQNPLIPLLSNCPYIDQLLERQQKWPSCQAYATLMSLPAIFADDETTIPHNIPYIFPPKERIEYWANQLKKDTNYKIGLCWQPDPHNDSSRLPIARRGIPLSLLTHIAQQPNISLYSLQQKEGTEQIYELPDPIKIQIFDNSFDVTHGSFIDTAAVMHSLDLIISTDTATAHLAGAMGKHVWLLLPYSTDWRWLAGRIDTPWYPTMRIFKQPHPFDWDSVITEVKQALKLELNLK